MPIDLVIDDRDGDSKSDSEDFTRTPNNVGQVGYRRNSLISFFLSFSFLIHCALCSLLYEMTDKSLVV